ncbi:MAG: hypothetical protein J6T45_07345 [Fibrobacterales bacterium]|nr:hypothetical protein [Fibrobacterales bacterium]
MGGERWWNRKIPARKVEWVIFVLALIALVLLPLPRIGFLDDQHHAFLSSHGMTLAAHLSPEHHFLMYNRVVLDADGVERIEPYNRFSIVPFALIRCAMAFGGNDLIDQFICARKLMLAFLLGAMFCAYLAFRRLRPGSWAVPVVIALAFSSKFCLYYGDMVFNDIPELFGCMLTFHGFVVYWQEKRFGQLLAKALMAVALGWQIYAMILPVAVCIWLKERNSKDAIRLATIPIAMGVLLLSFNFAQEYAATRKPILEMPSVQSALGRMGLVQGEAYLAKRSNELSLNQAQFVKQQILRAVYATTPAIVAPMMNAVYGALPGGTKINTPEENGRLFALFAPIVAIAMIPLFVILLRRRKISVVAAIPLISLALLWSFPMKNFTMIHDFQGLFWIGMPLIFYDALFALFPEKSRVFPLFLTLALLAGMGSFLRLSENKIYDSAESVARVAALQSETSKFGGEVHPKVFVDGYPPRIVRAAHGLECALPHAVFARRLEQADYVLHDDPVRIERMTKISALRLIDEANRKDPISTNFGEIASEYGHNELKILRGGGV